MLLVGERSELSLLNIDDLKLSPLNLPKFSFFDCIIIKIFVQIHLHFPISSRLFIFGFRKPRLD